MLGGKNDSKNRHPPESLIVFTGLRKISILALVLTIVFMLLACGNSSPPGNGDSSPEDALDDKTLASVDDLSQKNDSEISHATSRN